MKMDGGVMKMRPVASGIEIKPGQTVTLDPSGYHVMFVGLKQQLKQGEHFKATLEFAKAGKVDVDFIVEGIGAKSGGGAMPGMGGMQMNEVTPAPRPSPHRCSVEPAHHSARPFRRPAASCGTR